MNPTKINPRYVAYMGDIHEDYAFGKKMIMSLGNRGVQAIVQVGDFGFRFGEYFLDVMTYNLRKYDIPLFFVDGNHDWLNWILTHEKIDGVVPITDYITYLPRGYRWEWRGSSFVALGGADSIDKTWRTPGVDWWPEEAITYQDVEIVSSGGYADYMICHDVPYGVDVPAIKGNPMGWPSFAVKASENHRQILRAAVDEVKPQTLIHGHMHCRYDDILVGEDYKTKVIGLDMNAYPWYENVVVADLERNLIFDGKRVEQVTNVNDL